MAALAEVADLEARIGRALTAAEAARAAALLTDASALIRGYTKQQFELVEDDEIELPARGVFLTLPQRPVLAVASVVAIGGGGIPDLTLPSGSWLWDGIETIELYPLDTAVWVSLPAAWADGYTGTGTYRATYDHGYATIPDNAVAICCRMVLAALLAPTMSEGLVSERIGQYSYQMGQFPGGGSQGATVRLTEQDKTDLKDAGYKRTSGTTALRIR